MKYIKRLDENFTITESKMDKEFKAMYAAIEKHDLLMKIANELFPKIAKKQKDGKLVNFIPLSQKQRDQVYDELVDRIKDALDESVVNEGSEKEDAKEIFDELMDVNGEEIADMDSQEAMTILSKRGIRGGKANKIAKELLKLTGAINEAIAVEGKRGAKKVVTEQMDLEDELANEEFGMDFDQLGSKEKEWVRDEMEKAKGNYAK